MWNHREEPVDLVITRVIIKAAFCLSIVALEASGQAPVSPSKFPSTCALSQPAPALPLRTNGPYIFDAEGARFKLSGVAWYGAESTDFVVGGLQLEPLDEIVEHIVCLGFNAVRLPWSNEMYESNPIVPDYAVTANPQLKGLRALAVYDRVVRAAAGSAGNYVEFLNCSGKTFFIEPVHAGSSDNQVRAPINGVQILGRW
jgi:hypothetical protein